MALRDKIKKFTTISKIAELLETSQPNITQRVQRESLTFAELQIIADACGISVSDLVADEECTNSPSLTCPHCGKPIRIELGKVE